MIENIALEHFDRVRVNKAANSAIGWHPFEDRDQLIVRITNFIDLINVDMFFSVS